MVPGMFRVMTLNIWNYTSPWPARRALIAGLIEAYQPDVALLQETRRDFRWERGLGQGEQLAQLTGYHATSAVGQVYIPLLHVDEGLTILSRREPVDVAVCRLEQLPHERQDENQRICLSVRLCQGHGEVDVYDTHFSLSPLARKSNAVEVRRFVDARSSGLPAILGGDLNAEPESAPLATLTDETATSGFLDVWQSARPDDPGFTYPCPAPVRRIDYLLVRNVGAPAWAELVGRPAEPGGLCPSDHLGLLADIEIGESREPAGHPPHDDE
jgi:endonuclease/exonuclease/phosphatase family metal-dependent hydrolase